MPTSGKIPVAKEVVVPRRGSGAGIAGEAVAEERRAKLLRQLARLLPDDKVSLVDRDLQSLLAELRGGG